MAKNGILPRATPSFGSIEVSLPSGLKKSITKLYPGDTKILSVSDSEIRIKYSGGQVQIAQTQIALAKAGNSMVARSTGGKDHSSREANQ